MNCRVLGDVNHIDVSLLSNATGLCGTIMQRLVLEIMTWLLKIIRRPCGEQFHVGTGDTLTAAADQHLWNSPAGKGVDSISLSSWF